MTHSKQARMLQMDFSLQKKSKIPKSYNNHRTKLLSSDQLQVKERTKKPNLTKNPQTNQQTPTNNKKNQQKNPLQKNQVPPNSLSFFEGSM